MHSPHSVKVVIRRYVVLVIAGKAQLVPVALVDKVPQLFGAQRLTGAGEREVKREEPINTIAEKQFLSLADMGKCNGGVIGQGEILFSPCQAEHSARA